MGVKTGSGKGNRGKGTMKMVEQMLTKMMGGGGGRGGGWRRKSIVHRTGASKKIWISGLPQIEEKDKRKEASKKLKEVFEKKGTECKFAEVWANGQGCAIFASEDEAQSAVGTLEGTKFRGKTLEIDVWETKAK